MLPETHQPSLGNCFQVYSFKIQEKNNFMVKIKSTVGYSACQYVLTNHCDVFLDAMGILQLD